MRKRNKTENNASFLAKLAMIFKEEHLENYQWLIGEDIEVFMLKRVNKTIKTVIVSSLAFMIVHFLLGKFIGYWTPIPVWILLDILIAYLVFKNDFYKMKNRFKMKRDAVYKSFPLWVSTLEILIMTNNVTNTFKKSIATCPDAIKDDLIEFVHKIEYNPEAKEHYFNFLRKYNIEEVNEIIMDMYAFNKLNKDEIVYEFKNLNQRLNAISTRIRQERQNRDLFAIAALNSVPLFTVSVYILLISMLMNIA